jgi:hypothetical protein
MDRSTGDFRCRDRRSLCRLLNEAIGEPGKRPLGVRLDSPGGNLIEALRVGELIRTWGLNASVGKTLGEQREWGSVYSETLVPGQCASACAYAFLGGEKRTATGGKIGVHQHYSDASLEAPFEQSASAIDRSVDQLATGLVLEYVIRMGVDPRLVTKASSIAPWEGMHWLSEDELVELSVDNTTDRYTDPRIVPFSTRGAALEVAHIQGIYANAAAPTRFRLYCRGEKRTPHLAVIFIGKSENDGAAFSESVAPNIDFSVKDADGVSTLFKPEVADITIKKNDDKTVTVAASWSFPQGDSEVLQSAGSIEAVDRAETGVPHVYFDRREMLSLELNSAERMAKLVFRNCIP